MKRVLIGPMVGVIACAIGIASAAIWNIEQQSTITTTPAGGCEPHYDKSIVATRIREDDEPSFYNAFQELPLYALPDCVDEAYSLTWIPSFHAPVLVRVWRSGGRAFMVAKALDTKGGFKSGNVKEANSRPLTDFEWREFTGLLNRTSYWELPTTVDEIAPQDGALWLIDGLRTKQYHWVSRRVPDEQYAAICKHLIRLSGIDTAHDLYLP